MCHSNVKESHQKQFSCTDDSDVSVRAALIDFVALREQLCVNNLKIELDVVLMLLIYAPLFALTSATDCTYNVKLVPTTYFTALN